MAKMAPISATGDEDVGPALAQKLRTGFFFSVLVGCLALVCVAAIGCQHFDADEPRLASLTFCSRNSRRHNPKVI